MIARVPLLDARVRSPSLSVGAWGLSTRGLSQNGYLSLSLSLSLSSSTQSEGEHGRTPLRTRTRPDCHKSVLRLHDEAKV